MHVGEKIRYFRKKEGLSQRELADRLFVSHQAISQWENNHSEPSRTNLIELAKQFEVQLEFFIDDSLTIEYLDDSQGKESSKLDIEALSIGESTPIVSYQMRQTILFSIIFCLLLSLFFLSSHPYLLIFLIPLTLLLRLKRSYTYWTYLFLVFLIVLLLVELLIHFNLFF